MPRTRKVRPNPAGSSSITPWAAPKPSLEKRAARGRQAYYAGLAAEEAIARDYERRGCRIVEKRKRTPYGELDLIVDENGTLVFVEVKRRKHDLGSDSPITYRQWQRLEFAALHYIMASFEVTRVHPACRFDVAVVSGNGRFNIIENTRTFDEI